MEEARGWNGISIAAVATLALVLFVTLLVLRKQKKLPPGPRGWPILGSLPLLAAGLPHQVLYHLSKQYGPLMFMRLGSAGTLVVTSSRLAEEVLKTHDKIMANRPPVPAVAKLINHDVDDIGWLPYGERWRYLRKICTLGLLTVSRINHFREIRQRELLATIHFILEESQRGIAVNMSETFTTLNFNNITQMTMNRSYLVRRSFSEAESVVEDSELSTLPAIFKEMFNLLGEFNLGDYVPVLKPLDAQGLLKRAKRVREKWDGFFDNIVKEHQQRPPGENYKEDFVDALLGIGKTKEFEEPLGMEVIRALLLDMISAAGDTSAVTLIWALSELMRNPSVMRKVQEELDSVVGLNRLVQEEDLPQLKYFNAVVKETMRLHPSGPLLIPHKSFQDCEINGFHIPAQTVVFVNVWAIHRDPEVWERPLDFNPERFLKSNADFKGQDFDFFPFGSGRRQCPGLNLGLLMVMYPLALCLHAVDWTLPPGQKPEEMDMSEIVGSMLFRKDRLTVFGKARLPRNVIDPALEGK